MKILAPISLGVCLAKSCQPAPYTTVGPIGKRPDDPRSYEGLVLENQLRVLLVSDPNAKQAAASLVVSAGAQDDPVPGMTHLVEHLVLMGGIAYPKENVFLQNVTLNGGNFAASTYYDRTGFSFTVTPSALKGALAIFSDVLARPQFTHEQAINEAHAIQAEYELRAQELPLKIRGVYSSATKPGHPFTKFSMGTLATLTRDNAEDLHSRVHQHMQKHYSANLMQLVVVSPAPPTELKGMVRAFAGIPNRGLQATDPGSPFGPELLPRAIEMNPNSPGTGFEVQFVFPGAQHISQHAIDFIAYFLTRRDVVTHFSEQKGSWELGPFSTGVSEKNHIFWFVRVAFPLAPESRQGALLALQDFFAYLAVFRREAVNDSVYQGYLSLLKNKKEVAPPPSPLQLADGLAEAIHLGVPIQETVMRLDPPAALDRAAVLAALDCFTPSAMQTIHYNARAHTQTHEPWFDSDYSTSPFTEEELASLVPAYPLQFPQIDFPVHDSAPRAAKGMSPKTGTGFTLWHADSPAKQMSTLRVRIAGQNIMQTDAHLAKLNLLNKFLTPSLDALAPGFETKEESISHTTNYNSLEITLVASEVEDALVTILQLVKSFRIDAKTFAAVKADLLAASNPASTNGPMVQAYTVLQGALFWENVSPDFFKQALPEVAFEDFDEWTASFLSCTTVDALFVGRDAQPLVDAIASFQKCTVPCANPTKPRELAMVGDAFLRHPITDARQINNAISFYLDLYSDAESQAMAILARNLMKVDFIAQLRVKERLTYALDVELVQRTGGGGLVLNLQGKADPVHLESRINAFLQSFVSKIESMALAVFEHRSQAVARAYPTVAVGDQDYFGAFWAAIKRNDTGSSRDAQIKEALATVTKSSFVHFINTTLPRGAPSRKKLSVHAVLPNYDVDKNTPEEVAACGQLITDLRQWQNAAIRA